MDFEWTAEQAMLRDNWSGYLADRYDFERRRTIIASAAGWCVEHWRALAQDLGLLGASFPEPLGGSGGDAVENLVVLEEAGRVLMVEPYLETVVLCGGLLQQAGGALARETIARIIAGEAVLAYAGTEPQARDDAADLLTTARRDGEAYVLDGHKAVVMGAPWATHFIVSARSSGAQRARAGVSLFLVERETAGLSLESYPTVDGRRAADLRLTNVRLPAANLIGEEGEGLALIEPALDAAVAAQCAEAVGVMRRMLADTVDYTRQRKQFGVAIGSFQVLQHRLVDMHMAIEQSVALTAVATMTLGASPRERALAVSAAKVQVGRSLRLVGQGAVQMHGGMGVTEELAVGHCFRRASTIQQSLGSVDHHLSRYAALL